jgi:hypothetical protein
VREKHCSLAESSSSEGVKLEPSLIFGSELYIGFERTHELLKLYYRWLVGGEKKTAAAHGIHP